MSHSELPTARYYHLDEAGKVACDLCPRRCVLGEGQRAFCFVRQNVGGEMVLTTYGRSSGFCIDPIEKKPLYHFYPGSSVLSFGTAGCNLGCRFCQNWDISKARQWDRLSATATPEMIAASAVEHGCTSVACTYNDPVIFAEYAIDVAAACRERGVKTVAVTAGYITAEARPEFFSAFDAVNVDLKAFTEAFYRRQAYGELAPVLDTLRYLCRETDVWVEITTLLIPGLNDSEAELAKAAEFIATELGDSVPLHYSAFHPDYKLTDLPATPPATVKRARDRALAAGLKYVYTGNIRDARGQSTHCPACHAVVIPRDGYSIGKVALDPAGNCACGYRIAGHVSDKPQHWGPRRLPVHIG